jgi:hypothetical protein
MHWPEPEAYFRVSGEVRNLLDVFRTVCVSKGLPIAVINSGFGPFPIAAGLNADLSIFLPGNSNTTTA